MTSPVPPATGFQPDGPVLHGYPVSNYFNIAHAALLETGMTHSVVDCRASQDEGFLARSPMGKIPFLETPYGYLAETIAMVEYIDAVSGGPRLYPASAFQRARTTQLINIAQTYIEAPARSLYPAVFMDGEATSDTIETSRAMIERALTAILRAGQFSPFLFGETFTASDLFTFFCLDMADRVMRFTCGRKSGAAGLAT